MDYSRIYLAYAEAVSAVDFMVSKYGKPAILKLVQAYAAAKSDDAAFTAALGVDVAGFDAAWEAELGVSPVKYGQQPAPTGPNTTNGPTPTSAPGTPSNRSGGSSNQAVFVIAGLMAVVGVALVGASIYLVFSTRR